MFIFKQKLEHVEQCTLPNKKIIHPLLKDYEDLNKTYQEHIYRDLELFEDTNGDNSKSILVSIDNTKTLSGRVKLQNMFLVPQNISKLHEKYKIISNNFNVTNNIISSCEPIEDSLLIYCENDRDDLNDLLTNVTINFPYVNKFNQSKFVMNIYNNYSIFSPFLNILTPIIMFVLTLLFSQFAFFKYIKYLSFSVPSLEPFKEGRYFSGIITIAMFLFSLYTSTMYSVMNQKLIKKMYYFNQNVKKMQELLKSAEDKLVGVFDVPINTYDFLSNFYKSDYSLYKDKGKIIVDFNNIRKYIEPIKLMLSNLGLMDAYCSIVTLINSKGYSYTKLLNRALRPTIIAQDIFMPSIGQEKSIRNSIELRGKNAVIFGPNAMGKSTFIKALALCVIFSQSLGIVPAKGFAHSPFEIINTYMNLSDKKGEKSLYEMELERMQNQIETLEKLPYDKFSFMIVDEMFSGTNPDDGAAASRSVAEKLSSFGNSISIITTHYKELSKIDDNLFKKYYLEKYELKRGSVIKTNGIEILKKKKFDENVIKRAQELKKNIHKDKSE
jgi:hypothetical protein